MAKKRRPNDKLDDDGGDDEFDTDGDADDDDVNQDNCQDNPDNHERVAKKSRLIMNLNTGRPDAA